MHKLVYLCDWLPPDFGAVGQYSMLFARQRARDGEDVLLVGLSTTADSTTSEKVGAGRLTIRRLKAREVDRSNFARRLLWTIRVNLRLIFSNWPALCRADEILFTASPPFLLHFLAPLNLLLRKQLTYRITDFHPECLIAGMQRAPLVLKALYALTVAWRRTVHRFEVLGEDQRGRLLQIGIPTSRIELKRDPSPVTIPQSTLPLPRPAELAGYVILLYSGNFGHAHDYATFLEGYCRHHREGSGRVALWLGAIGAGADQVERELRAEGLPVFRSRPVPLEQLARLLVTPDAHLITLRDAFVGFVMPSKVYGCIESGRDVLYIGSTASDVHLLCSQNLPPDAYHRAAVGDAAQVARKLEAIADRG